MIAVSLVNKWKSFNISFLGVTGKVEFDEGTRLRNITLVQVKGNSEVEIGYYDSKSLELRVYANSFSGNIPRGATLTVNSQTSTAHTTVVLLAFASCFIFLSITLTLFIYFRKSPEVKATSVTLSLCMYFGCYGLLLYIPLLLLDEHPIDHVSLPTNFKLCMCSAWFSVIGFPLPVIFATILLKMLRVYLIFSHPHSYKRKLFSDGALFIYLLLIITPNIFILILWSTVDPLVEYVVQSEHDNFIEILERCKSNHIFIWPILLIVYLSILIITVVIIAFKTLTIRFKNFRDTKATNAFAFIAIFVTVMTLMYWYFFRSLEPPSRRNSRASAYTLYAGHFIITISCPCLLFISFNIKVFEITTFIAFISQLMLQTFSRISFVFS